MKEIPLRNKSLVALVDDDIYEIFGHLTWSAFSTPNNLTPYARHDVQWGGRRLAFLLHREILGAPRGIQVDHINGDGLDNRRENLRLVSPSENMRNRPAPKSNKSGYKGVSFYKSRGLWQAQIQVEGKKKTLGYFSSPEVAFSAYCQAAERLHGQFARVDGEGWVTK